MISQEELTKIVINWADTVPFNVKICLFGSYLKGKLNPTDIDLSLEFLHNFTEKERKDIWYECHTEWQGYLSTAARYKIHLSLHEEDDSPNMHEYLKSESVTLCHSVGKAFEYKIGDPIPWHPPANQDQTI